MSFWTVAPVRVKALARSQAQWLPCGSVISITLCEQVRLGVAEDSDGVDACMIKLDRICS